MKLSHPIAIKSASLILSWWLRSWMGSLDIRKHFDDPEVEPHPGGRPVIYSFWHENILLAAHLYAVPHIASLIGQHRDGELIAQVVRRLRGAVVRGSSTRGGMAALREMLRRGRATHVAITPDGPRGPRRMLQNGAIYLASRSGMPIVPVGFGYDSCWRARSWDRMALPRPGRRAVLLLARPIQVPADLDVEGLEPWRAAVQAAMDEVQARAQRMADGVQGSGVRGQDCLPSPQYPGAPGRAG